MYLWLHAHKWTTQLSWTNRRMYLFLCVTVAIQNNNSWYDVGISVCVYTWHCYKVSVAISAFLLLWATRAKQPCALFSPGCCTPLTTSYLGVLLLDSHTHAKKWYMRMICSDSTSMVHCVHAIIGTYTLIIDQQSVHTMNMCLSACNIQFNLPQMSRDHRWSNAQARRVISR